MRAYIFTLPIDEIEIGKVYASLPLHCTLMPWFSTGAAPQELIERVAPLFRKTGPIALVSKEFALIGADHDIPVHLLRYNIALRRLHDSLLRLLNGMGVLYLNRTFVGDGYRPHVTTIGAHAFGEGSRAVVRVAHLFEALSAQEAGAHAHKRALAELPLS